MLSEYYGGHAEEFGKRTHHFLFPVNCYLSLTRNLLSGLDQNICRRQLMLRYTGSRPLVCLHLYYLRAVDYHKGAFCLPVLCLSLVISEGLPQDLKHLIHSHKELNLRTRTPMTVRGPV